MRILIIIVSVAFFATACGPKCKKGHDERVTVPAYTYTTYDNYGIGKHSISIPRQVTEPAHTEIRRVCDEYEAEK